MSEIYWLTVLGGLYNLCNGTAVICGISLAIAIFISTMITSQSYPTEGDINLKNRCSNYIKKMLIPFIIAIIGTCFIPSTKQLYMIYGIGGTIDYIKSNDTAKQIPDKVINAIDKYIDSFNNDND